MSKKILKSFLSLYSVFCFFPAIAGDVKVINENKKYLRIRIQADGDPVSENLTTYLKDIPEACTVTFKVTADDLKGKTHFSIKGDTSAFTPGGKCNNLSVDKSYKITFLNDTAGTSCIAEETPK